MAEKTRIITSDLYFAAFLQSAGCKIIETKRDTENKNIFVFEDEQGRKTLSGSYFNQDEASAIPALRYANAIRSLKTMIFVR
jgi:hypothetical protein